MELKEKGLQELNQQLVALISGETNWLANLSNAAALLYNHLDRVNWAGFYLLREEELVLGPFQGKPACIRIPLGKGVCGKAAQDRKTVVVPDVHQFPGHITCDQASESEIVVPMIKEEKLLGVMDIDSPVKERFDQIDARYLEEFVGILLKGCLFE